MNTSRIPLVKSDRLAFFILFGLGMAMCTSGIAQAPVRGWAHPISIMGYLMGGLALLLGLSVLTRKRFGPIQSDRASIVALLCIIVVKFILAAFYSVF